TSSRKRTHLKPSQVAILQETFVSNTLPDANHRCRLALELGVSERTIQIWFQNRRAKARKLESVGTLVSNVRTGWVDIPSKQMNNNTTFRTCMTPEYFEADTMIKRRPRSSSKPERATSFSLLPQRAMSESQVGKNKMIEQESKQKSLISFTVEGIHVGTWTRFSRRTTTTTTTTTTNEWDLFCFSDIIQQQLIWQIHDGGHQFRIEVAFDNIQEIKLGQRQLYFEIKSPALVSFSMLRNNVDSDWVRCNDFTENQQASDSQSHTLQGSDELLRQSLLELMAQAPELASKLVIAQPSYRDLTISPLTTPE
ncbi:uncharacterized protein BX663DRAFT_420847, partial [Cokeromyces recurvatus]|uniref:uncharacterized protein n=1 Tax=Cokeromyces recurvatus TaxID=90255 RepID=UPI002220BB70